MLTVDSSLVSSVCRVLCANIHKTARIIRGISLKQRLIHTQHRESLKRKRLQTRTNTNHVFWWWWNAQPQQQQHEHDDERGRDDDDAKRRRRRRKSRRPENV